MILWVVVIGVIVLFALIWWSKVEVRIDFEKHARDESGSVQVRYLYAFRWQKKLRAIQNRLDKPGAGVVSVRTETPKEGQSRSPAPGGESKQRATLTGREALHVLKHWRRWLALFKEGWPQVKRLLGHVVVQSLETSLVVGTGDAVTCGVACGAASAAAGTATGVLTHWCRFHSVPEIAVRPDFHSETFDVRVHCIADVRLGHAMVAGARLWRVWKRRATHGASDSRFDADRHDEHS